MTDIRNMAEQPRLADADVVKSVIPHLMAALMYSSYERWVTFRLITLKKESRVHLGRVEDIEDTQSVFGMWAVVECQRNGCAGYRRAA